METQISLFWSIVFGVVIGVGANLLTPYIARLAAKTSASARERLKVRDRAFADAVQHLIENPLDEINLRLENSTREILVFLILAIACLVANYAELTDKVVSTVFSIILAALCLMVALYFLLRCIKYWRLLSAAWDARRKKYPNARYI